MGLWNSRAGRCELGFAQVRLCIKAARRCSGTIQQGWQCCKVHTGAHQCSVSATEHHCGGGQMGSTQGKMWDSHPLLFSSPLLHPLQ